MPLGLALLLIGIIAPAAGATRDAEALLRVAEPTQGQGVFASGQRLRVIVRRGATLRVRVGSRDVTGRVHLRRVKRRPHARVMAGRLPRRLLSGHPKDVTFTARSGERSDGDSVLVQAVSRHPSFLRLRLRRHSRRAPVEAVIRTRRHGVWLRAALNGRRIEDRSEATRIGVRRLRLTRTEGLRPGRNVLRIAANGPGGRGDVERRVFRLKPRAVIPGVRAPRSVQTGNVVRLDAAPSFARGPGRLDHRWRIVGSPEGSHPRLRGARRRVARLRVDGPGHYSVQLVSRRHRRSGGRGAHRRRPAAAPVASSRLVTDVTAQAPIPPYGIPLDLDPSEGISLGGSTKRLSGSTGSLLLVAIDSATGAVKKSSQVSGSGSGPAASREIETFLDTLNDYLDPNTVLAILGDSSLDTFWCTESRLQELSDRLPDLGIDNADSYTVAAALACGAPFAYVGTPGGIPGSAYVNLTTGRLSGYLRLTGLSSSLTGTLVFEQPSYRLFQFGGARGATKVTGVDPPAGEKPSQGIDPAMAGDEQMEVTILDAYDLSTVASAGGSYGGQNGAITPVRNLLDQYAGDEDKLVLFKMDGITAWENTRLDMSPILKRLTAMGANRDAFIRSLAFPESNYGGDQYIFFGGAGVAPVEGTDAITAEAPGGGSVEVSSPTLTGMLRRDHLGRWAPTAARNDDTITQPLQALAVRAPVAYSYPSNPSGSKAQYQAAEARLFKALTDAGVLCTPGPDCGVPKGVRVNYANQELLDNAGDAITALKCAGGGGFPVDSGSPYTQAQFHALRMEVCGELEKLELIHDKLFGVLIKDVFPALASDSTLDLLSGSDTYLGFLEEKRDESLSGRNKFLGVSGAAAEVLSDMFSGATAVADYVLAPETGGASILGGSVIGEALMLGGDSLGLASNASGAKGSDKVAPTMVTVGNLYVHIQDSFGYATARTAESEALIASDPTKLSDAAAKVTDGSWDLEQQINYEHQTYQAVIFQQRVSALRYMLPRMLSVDAEACDTGGSSDDPTTYEAWSQLKERGQENNYLEPGEHRLRSVHVDSSAAHALGPRLFSAPFAAGTDPIAAGPAGAAIARSPFFMREVADTTDSGKGDCTENFSH